MAIRDAAKLGAKAPAAYIFDADDTYCYGQGTQYYEELLCLCVRSGSYSRYSAQVIVDRNTGEFVRVISKTW